MSSSTLLSPQDQVSLILFRQYKLQEASRKNKILLGKGLNSLSLAFLFFTVVIEFGDPVRNARNPSSPCSQRIRSFAGGLASTDDVDSSSFRRWRGLLSSQTIILSEIAEKVSWWRRGSFWCYFIFSCQVLPMFTKQKQNKTRVPGKPLRTFGFIESVIVIPSVRHRSVLISAEPIPRKGKFSVCRPFPEGRVSKRPTIISLTAPPESSVKWPLSTTQ